MLARRCSGCNLNWPHTAEYVVCPQCQDKTDAMRDVPPMPADEAAHLAKHAKFDRYYAAHCQELGIPVEGPLYS